MGNAHLSFNRSNYIGTFDSGGVDTSIPPFDTGETITIQPESFPNGDQFIEKVLEGQNDLRQ